MRKMIWILSIIPLLILGIIIFIPIKFNINGLDNLRNLYSIISAIGSVLIGSLGIIIGYYYYKDKRDYDSKLLNKNQINNNIKLILDEYKVIDNIIRILFNKGIKNQSELETAREKMMISFDNITILLDCNDKLIKLTDEELRSTSRQYSTIEKNTKIMRDNYSKYKNNDYSNIKEKYEECYRHIKNCLYQKMI